MRKWKLKLFKIKKNVDYKCAISVIWKVTYKAADIEISPKFHQEVQWHAKFPSFCCQLSKDEYALKFISGTQFTILWKCIKQTMETGQKNKQHKVLVWGFIDLIY